MTGAPEAAPGEAIGPAGVPRQVTARATWLLAPNPGPMMFDGTNSWVLPGHGPVVAEPGPLLTLALEAREARLAQIEQAVRDGHRSVSAIAERLYGGFDERIRRPVEATVLAHVRYLREVGRISWSEGW